MPFLETNFVPLARLTPTRGGYHTGHLDSPLIKSDNPDANQQDQGRAAPPAPRDNHPRGFANFFCPATPGRFLPASSAGMS
jgi:hypothetical protein